MQRMTRPVGYLHDWTLSPGSTVELRASGDGRAQVQLVRLSGLIGKPLPHAYAETALGEPVDVMLSPQPVPAGSFAHAAHGPAVPAGDGWCWRLRLFPTLVDQGEVMAWGDGPRIALDQGMLVAAWQGQTARLPISARSWWECELALQDGAMSLTLTPVGGNAWALGPPRRAAMPLASQAIAGPLVLGRGFNGKLEAPSLEASGAVVARWDFAAAMTTQHVPGEGPRAAPLALVNAPRRAVTGSRWTGEHHDWTTQPGHYGAIHFHDDDLSDCCWPVTAALPLPEDTSSGIYAVRIDSAAGTRHVPFFVRGRKAASIAFLVPTFSYLAYGNSRWHSVSGGAAQAPYVAELADMQRHGLSLYSLHRDGSGIGSVTRRRPIINSEPGFLGEAIGGQVLFNDDLRIIAWLDALGMPYDIVTDDDLHAQGTAALAGYRVILTGVHPEYHSRQTLDAIEGFAATGGRIIYLGGNGFYWRVDMLPGAQHVMELRRAEGGIRTWAEEPGEYVHQSDGRLGGLWRRLGRAPNQLVGIGFSAQGVEDDSAPFARTPAAADPRAAWLFEGVIAEPFGCDQGFGAAAGYELDRADWRLGTPAHALVIAQSLPMTAATWPVNEERLTTELLTAEDPIRADITFFERKGGGAVLSFGSIMLAGCLEETDGLGRLLANAVRRFAAPEPFALPPG
jgi:N,N-dimethylformamidase